MDASYTFLPVSAREYLHWLKDAHSSNDNWLRFEQAIDALQVYTGARAEANLCKTNRMSGSAAASLSSAAVSTPERRELFLALARQIVAQEELRLAIASCRQQCEEETLSSDAERFLAWLQARLLEAETEVRMANLLTVHKAEPEVSLAP